MEIEITDASPQPRRTDWNRPYFERAAAREFVLQHCDDCGKTIYYPRVACPNCLSYRTSWKRASGLGTLYSFSIIWRPKHPAFDPLVPIILAAVELDEGPMVIVTLEDCDTHSPEIGMPVEVCFAATVGGPVLPRFRPQG